MSGRVKLLLMTDSSLPTEGNDALDPSVRRSAEVIGRTSTPITAEMLRAALSAAGVGDGSVIIVHSSLSRLGWVVGGAHTVVNALLHQVSPTGTVVMPACKVRAAAPAA